MNSASWQAFLAQALEEQLLSPVIVSLLKQVHVSHMDTNPIRVICPNTGASTFLNKNKEKIVKAFKAIEGKDVDFAFTVEEKGIKKEKNISPDLLTYKPSLEEVLLKVRLQPRYTFDSFAVSGSNSLAYAAAQSVAKNPGKSYNPLFFWGGVGVGKTHLAHAIGRKILEDNHEKQVFCAAGDMFTNELIESIKEKKTAQFRKKYRKLDLLIIDDVQFIAGKEAVQEEFFHTFNSIVSKGGQIILTSDKPPHHIKNLEDRLRSRFSGGLIVDIKEPDFELRSAILLIKAREKGIFLPIECAKIIAENITDTRALEGTLLTLHAKSFETGSEITLDMVEEYFSGKTQKEAKPIRERSAPSDIIRVICAYYNIKQTHLKSAIRTETVATARQLVMYILRNYLHLTLESIASILKRKDHTTIIHGITKIEKMLARDTFFKEEVDRIIKTLKLS